MTEKKTKEQAAWKPSAENKSKATRLRIFAALSWVAAIAAQMGAIYYISHVKPIAMWIPIVIMVVDAAFAITGGMLWKKSNHIDPPSEKNKFLFYIQSQLGLIVAIIAFLPLIIFIFTSKDLDKKQKGILGSIAVVLLVATGLVSTDWNPVSAEQYAAQTDMIEILADGNDVYGTKSGEKYHIYEDCQYLKNSTEVTKGSVIDLHEKNSHILGTPEALCSTCKKKAMKAKGLDDAALDKAMLDRLTERESEGTDK
ncbi:hypothetical protein G7081_00165 [Vagococcus coleopterorum]|uniref:Uncharacterized protein n=1 Tax=Vagococcus coleopterorum TaxID=2714946 RepID=A0A6G8AKW9_9ENTE|nr:hypothetical protein [Vagococcus coleopterorum]QIL45609.1 hypothetical protein G7081_00165 [Vagococcus coleopterorum]